MLALADAGTRNGATSVGDAAEIAVRNAEEAFRNGGRSSGIRTGIGALDAQLGGFAPTQFIVGGGRPGVRKTVFGTTAALAAAEAGVGVAFFSLEMSAPELAERLLANLAGIAGTLIRDGRLSQAQWDNLLPAQRELAALPILIDDTPGLTMEQIRLRTRSVSRKQPVGLVIVGHLGLLGAPKGMSKLGPTVITEENSKALKRLAKELGIPVLALAQLNRGLESREDRRPALPTCVGPDRSSRTPTA